jgi:hypothetical protein
VPDLRTISQELFDAAQNRKQARKRIRSSAATENGVYRDARTFHLTRVESARYEQQLVHLQDALSKA